MKYTGARIVIESLIKQGVNRVFGYPGGTILNIYDELYKQKDRISHVLTAHEQGACHAADGYSRATGKTGVVFATSGPGATNLVTGIATAYMDSSPLIAITCNVATPLLGKDSFQEVDICGITMSITKHNYIVRDVNSLADIIEEAFIIANTGRKGPVLIDIPKEITALTAEWDPMRKFKPVSEKINQFKIPEIKMEEIDRAVELIEWAKRPLIYAGGGVISSEACDVLVKFAEKKNIPVCESLMGRTVMPSSHPLCTGMIGMHGTKASNSAASSCDLLIALGARFSDRVTSDVDRFAPDARVIHVDIDPAEINKNIKDSVGVVGDVKKVLELFLEKVSPREADSWNDKVSEWKKMLPSSYVRKSQLHPKFVMETINKILGDNTIITTEVGQHQMWAAQFYPYSRPRSLITSGGLGTMGFGTGAAMGAQAGCPDKYVVHIAGDGSFRMNCNELATIQYYNFPIIIIVADNGTLGMVRQWQKLFYDKRYSETTLDRGPDFVKLAEAYGIRGFRAKNEEEFVSCLKEAVSNRTPCLIDCFMNIDEMVMPMVPTGKPLDSIIMD